MSVRQVAKAAGISNPYLSQIERGLRRPSAEILQQLAKGLRISAEQLYVRAGILDDSASGATVETPYDVTVAILADERLNDRQRRALLDVYRSFVGDGADEPAGPAADPGSRPSPAPATTTHDHLPTKE